MTPGGVAVITNLCANCGDACRWRFPACSCEEEEARRELAKEAQRVIEHCYHLEMERQRQEDERRDEERRRREREEKRHY